MERRVWSFGLLAACGLSLVCGGLVGWYGIGTSVGAASNNVVPLTRDEVSSLDIFGQKIAECDEQVEILNDEGDELVKQINALKQELAYERLISERLKLAVLQSWSERFDIEQKIHDPITSDSVPVYENETK